MSRAFLPHVITDDSALGGAKIQRGLRFDGVSCEARRTFGTNTSDTTKTFSFWMKRGNISSGSIQNIVSTTISGNIEGRLRINTDDTLQFEDRDASGGSSDGRRTTTAKFRDTNSWYHIMLVLDSTQGTELDRAKIYVNGTQDTNFSATRDISQNYSFSFLRSSAVNYIGNMSGSSEFFDGYLAEINFIDGQALDSSYFGFTDPVTGIWMPKRYEGTYGTNGFRLDFSDNTSQTTLGIDKSPNGNDFTIENIYVRDSVLDTPSNNFVTLNPLNSTQTTLSQGNLKAVLTNSDARTTMGTMGVKSGKWYYEVYINSQTVDAIIIGFANAEYSPTQYSGNVTGSYNQTDCIGYYGAGDGFIYYATNTRTELTGQDFTTGDIIGVAADFDNNQVYFYKNGSAISSANPYSYTFIDKQYLPSIMNATSSGNQTVTANFGQDSSFAGVKTAQGNADENGDGDFYYPVPSGFKTICSRNLAPNVPSIRPQRHFETILYTGDGQNNRRVTGLEFKPGLVWVKARAQSGGGEISADHGWYDSIRGVTKRLKSNSTDAEGTVPIKSFDDGGFTFDTEMYYNANASTFVAWCWKAGGAAVSNSDGSITSSVSANTTSGFSVVTWTGTNGTGTIGHGLGKAPKWIVIRRRDSASSWVVYHYSVGNTKRLTLDSIGAESSASANWFNNTSPTSTTFSVGSDGGSNGSTDGYVAWCWADISGFSKFDSYTGNGSTDGAFVNLGFRPAWLMVKRTSSTDSWLITDNKRDIDNPATQTQAPQSNREDNVNTGDNYSIDYLSNGFKCRGSGGDLNGSGETYIYMAFAETPETTPFDTFPNAR